jgi:hypothetical protein
MPFKVNRQVHLVFGIMEAVFHVSRDEDQTHHLDEGAARKSKQGDVGHWILQCRRRVRDFAKSCNSPKPRPGERTKMQYLGEMPQVGGRLQ